MANELGAQDLLPPEIGLTLLGFEKSEQGWLVRAAGRIRSECPSCGTESTARHSRNFATAPYILVCTSVSLDFPWPSTW